MSRTSSQSKNTEMALAGIVEQIDVQRNSLKFWCRKGEIRVTSNCDNI
ncbi:hypothetical protein [Desulfosporosinus hippei]|nr:hypothetical protein [Desulfosporosinus hippei]